MEPDQGSKLMGDGGTAQEGWWWPGGGVQRAAEGENQGGGAGVEGGGGWIGGEHELQRDKGNSPGLVVRAEGGQGGRSQRRCGEVIAAAALWWGSASIDG